VEVILAEISLNDSEKSGVEWLMNAGLGDYDLDFGTIDALGLSNGGFNLSVSSPAGVKAVVNLMYSNSQSTIRSRPRLMVKSGGQASIDVGDEVPIVTQSSQGTQDPNAPLVQTISYRNTGVLLEIKPTVHASGFIDIDVSQELSEAVNTTSSSIDSPTITNRRMVTTVTLRDGGAVLLGGLISSTQGEGETGVPILGQLPGIGNLFKSKTAEAKRTELMIMIIPYVLNSPEEAETLTDELQLNRMSELSL
jgi:general secretion pathway protein D